MKKSLIVAALLVSASVVRADGVHNDLYASEAFRILASIAFVVILIVFILTAMKYILESRLKNRIIDRGVTENLAASILQNTKKDDKLQTIKWFCLLAAVGTGLLIVYYTLPLDIHSMAIMAFSLSLGYLGYYFILKQHK